MKRRRCTSCNHVMKGHKKKRCVVEQELVLSCGSVYVGTVYDNKPSGRGRLNSEDLTYDGDFLNGERHGEGIEIKGNGCRYSGHWVRDMYQGYGCLKKDNMEYKGTFCRNRYHGKGILTKILPNGFKTVYTGQFSQHSKHGKGKHVVREGTYEGEFYYNARHGKGTFTFVNGDIYSGDWRRGIEHGVGVFTSSEETYTGDWVRGKRHGNGRWSCNYKGEYNGYWKRGLRHGKGVHVYKTGETYTGGFSNGERTGFGRLCSSDSVCIYRGFWLKDAYNGRGTLVEDGISFKGSWEDGSREGMFEETRADGLITTGPWTNDVRHGTFVCKNKKRLYLWGEKTSFRKRKNARAAAIKTMKKHDYQTADAILTHYPSILTWKFLYSHDPRGFFLCRLPKEIVYKNIQKYILKCFKKKQYVFLKHLMECVPEDKLRTLSAHVPELFDAITADFVPNPWIVRHNSYSESTKRRLLDGLHLGEFGRCEPKDPFTRLDLTEESGSYLNTMPALARSLYNKISVYITHAQDIDHLAYIYNVQDFETLLKNARDSNDKATVLRLIKERDLFIAESVQSRRDET
jgi:hypothetical protein